jgi:chromosome segregation ATPase
VEISLLSDRAQQIGIEGTASDVEALQNQIQQITNKAASLKKDAARKFERLQHVVAERHGFEDDLKKTVTFLHQKESQLRPHDHLDMDVNSIETELGKLRDVRVEVLGQLQVIQEQVDEQKAHYDHLDEVLPLEIQDKIDEMNILKEKILVWMNCSNWTRNMFTISL